MKMKLGRLMSITFLSLCLLTACKENTVKEEPERERYIKKVIAVFVDDPISKTSKEIYIEIEQKATNVIEKLQENRLFNENENVNLENGWCWENYEVLEDQMPTVFGRNELIQYCDNLFLTSTYYPDLLSVMGQDKLTQESIEKIQSFEWPDTELYQQLDWAETELTKIQVGQYICGTTRLTTHYIGYNFDQYYEIEYVWKVEDKKGGLFTVEDIKLLSKDSPEESISLKEKQQNMDAKESAAYARKLFLILTRNPAKINEYAEIFDAESVQKWKEIPWYYETPEKVYDESGGSVYYRDEKDLLDGYTVVSAHFPMGTVDYSQFPVNPDRMKEEEVQNTIDYFWPVEDRNLYPMFLWLVQIDWTYDSKTGVITIESVDIVPCV